MIVRLLITLTCLVLMNAAAARMYQWQDPETGTTHFSGKPPAWYRTGEGPRVIVFERGRVIDDTRIELPAETNAELRLQAIARAEEDREMARQKAMAAEEMKARMDTGEPLPAEEFATPLPKRPDEEVMAADEPPPPVELSPEGLTEEEMRALIQEWEKMRTEQALERIREGSN